jgi:hypothetical protein
MTVARNKPKPGTRTPAKATKKASSAATARGTTKTARPSKTKAAAAPRTPAEPAKKKAVASGDGAELRRQLLSARESIRILEEDRDHQVALAEASEMERGDLESLLLKARARIAELESHASEQKTADPGAREESLPLEFAAEPEEEEEEPGHGEGDLDDPESMYDRMDDPRVRRQELDRERGDRESEYGSEPFWMVCPKCGDSLTEIDSEDIKMERCENCGGLYLDSGEIDMLLAVARGKDGLRRIRSAFTF